jgi:DNA-binding transcriptional LysR family regulator
LSPPTRVLERSNKAIAKIWEIHLNYWFISFALEAVMVAINLPTDVLRSFLAVIDLGSFTKAGQLLGRTQPAISLQVRKLEELVGMTLMDTTGRNVVLTREGERLARYSRQLLAMNDEIVARLQHKETSGSLRVGLPNDYAVAFFQKALAHFSKLNQDVEMSIQCDTSEQLLAMFDRDELDIVVAMFDGAPPPGLIYTWAERPIWAASGDFDTENKSPIRIAAHPEGCHYRERMIRSLDQIGTPWRITFCSPGINGLQLAVQSGFGVTALTRRTLLRGMRVLTENDGFPPLPDIHVGMLFKNTGASTAALLLVNHIMKSLHDSGLTDFVRLERLDSIPATA